MNLEKILKKAKESLIPLFVAGMVYGCGPDSPGQDDYSWRVPSEQTQKEYVCLQFACRPVENPENPTSGKLFSIKVYDTNTGKKEISQNTDAFGKFSSLLPLDISSEYEINVYEVGRNTCHYAQKINWPEDFRSTREECFEEDFSYFNEQNIIIGDCENLPREDNCR